MIRKLPDIHEVYLIAHLLSGKSVKCEKNVTIRLIKLIHWTLTANQVCISVFSSYGK
jgi:uncharacterized membrane protein YqhA